jgi:hypothetical protein
MLKIVSPKIRKIVGVLAQNTYARMDDKIVLLKKEKYRIFPGFNLLN